MKKNSTKSFHSPEAQLAMVTAFRHSRMRPGWRPGIVPRVESPEKKRPWTADEHISRQMWES